MNQSMMEMVAEAKKIVPAIAPGKAATLLEAGNAMAIDVRNDGEVAQSGKISGALHIPLDQFVNIYSSAIPGTK